MGLERMRVRHREVRAWVAGVKEKAGCHDCKARLPAYCLTFDHVPERGPKGFTVGEKVTSLGKHRLAQEMEKCDVVCLNCHALRTHSRK